MRLVLREEGTIKKSLVVERLEVLQQPTSNSTTTDGINHVALGV